MLQFFMHQVIIDIFFVPPLLHDTGHGEEFQLLGYVGNFPDLNNINDFRDTEIPFHEQADNPKTDFIGKEREKVNDLFADEFIIFKPHFNFSDIYCFVFHVASRFNILTHIKLLKIQSQVIFFTNFLW